MSSALTGSCFRQLFLLTESSQLRWFGRASWMPGEIFQATLVGRKSQDGPTTRWRDYISKLAQCPARRARGGDRGEGVSPDKQQKLDVWFEIYKKAGLLQSHHMYV